MIWIVAFAAAQETGLPPKVEIVIALKDAAISGVAIVTPSGMPLATPLAIVMMSGSTPQCSIPHILPPVRPKPVCTSSQMKTPPYFLMISTAISKYSGGGVMKPPTPWIGSAMNPAMRPVVVVRISSSMSLAQAMPQEG